MYSFAPELFGFGLSSSIWLNSSRDMFQAYDLQIQNCVKKFTRLVHMWYI
jgi:hypothetical protein